MTKEELKAILDAHALWMRGDPKGRQADLSHADLRGADLCRVDLYKADLYAADLSNANIRNTNLNEANLYGACLSCANLFCTNLCNADLSHADLSHTNLCYASLCGASLYNAALSYANLSCANLLSANLHDANLQEANLYAARLDEHENIRKGITLKEPMVGYKKCRQGYIVTLEIPKGAIVYSINNNKCRTNKAKVTSIATLSGVMVSCATSFHDPAFVYKVGEEIDITETFNLMYNVECGTGIHFFRTREEAVNYTA